METCLFREPEVSGVTYATERWRLDADECLASSGKAEFTTLNLARARSPLTY